MTDGNDSHTHCNTVARNVGPLRPATNAAVIDGAFSGFVAQVQRGAEQRTLRGSHYWGVGMRSSVLHRREDLGIWFAYGTSDLAHWIGFGDDRTLDASVPLPGLVLSVPRNGTNRRLGGLFATDDTGGQFLLHSGKIGGKRRGISKTEFVLSKSDCETASVIWSDHVETQYFVLGKLSDAGLSEGVARYVRTVLAFKRNVQVERTFDVVLPNEEHNLQDAVTFDRA